MRKIGAICISIAVSSLIASGDMTNFKSINWQKLQLESDIKTKVDRSISSIISSGRYIVDVKITTSEPESVAFGKQEQDGDINSSNAAVDAQAEDKKASLDKYKIRYSDVSVDDADQDAVVFAKLGIEAPLVENLLKAEPSGDVKKDSDDVKTNETTALQKQIEYEQKFDIFNNLEGIVIAIKLSDKLLSQTRETVEAVVRGLSFNTNDVKPKIVFDYIAMTEAVAEEDKSIIERFSPYASYAFYGCMLIFVAGLVLYVMRKVEAMLQSNTAKDMNISMRGEQHEKEKQKEKEGAHAPASLGGGALASGKVDGCARFEELMDRSLQDAILLVKKWIKLGGDNEKLALGCLVHELDHVKLQLLLSKISSEEKNIWRGALASGFDEAHMAVAQRYIANQIITDIMNDSSFDDPELGELLLQISPDRAAMIIKKHPEMGQILFNVSSADFVNQVILQLDEVEVESVISDSANYNPTSLASNIENYKKIFKDHIGKRPYVPFMNRIPELFPFALGDKEKLLLDSLVEGGRIDEAKKLAISYCPSSVVEHLPIPFIKECLQQYPLAQKVEMLLALDPILRDKYIAIHAPHGSKAFELLDIELESRRRDEIYMRKIVFNKHTTYKAFVDFVRGKIKVNKQYREEIEETISHWVNERALKSGEQSNIVQLHIA